MRAISGWDEGFVGKTDRRQNCFPLILSTMDRRQFVTTAGSAIALAGAGRGLAQEAAEKSAEKAAADEAASLAAEPFKVLFAPEPQHFGGGKTIEIYLDAIKMAYDAGFRAWEDNWLVGRAADQQEKIGELLREKKMTMGVSVVTVGGGANFSQTYRGGAGKGSLRFP